MRKIIFYITLAILIGLMSCSVDVSEKEVYVIKKITIGIDKKTNKTYAGVEIENSKTKFTIKTTPEDIIKKKYVEGDTIELYTETLNVFDYNVSTAVSF